MIKKIINIKKSGIKFPPIGMRIFKSSIGVLLGFIIYFIRGCQGTPFYTALSVLWCMRPYITEAKKMALQRTIGTLVGGAYGLLLIVIEHEIVHFQYIEFLRYIVISIMLVPVLYTTVLMKKKNASYFACVVYLSVVVLHIKDENPYLFVFNRVLDTLVGIGVGLFVNTFTVPKTYRKDILFVSGLDNTLISMNEELSAYSKVELNRMIEQGANFTVSTMRTPASIVEELRGIDIKLPVIAMDGAVLFDIREKRYMKKFEITYDNACEIISLVKSQGIFPYTNVVKDDMCAIYYDEFSNEVCEKIYTKLRKSPYRNYIKAELPKGDAVVYFMLIEKKEKIEKLYAFLEKNNITNAYKIKVYGSRDYPGYSYMKIYNINATRENMLTELCNIIDLKKTVTFGSIEGKYDVYVSDDGANQVVKSLKRIYEVPFYTKKCLTKPCK